MKLRGPCLTAVVCGVWQGPTEVQVSSAFGRSWWAPEGSACAKQNLGNDWPQTDRHNVVMVSSVERAKTGKAKCQFCRSTIYKGALRFVENYQHWSGRQQSRYFCVVRG